MMLLLEFCNQTWKSVVFLVARRVPWNYGDTMERLGEHGAAVWV